MTALNIVSALISFFIYPYAVRMIGKEAFGVYPYALAWITYFQTVIDFGFDSPAAKAIVENRDNKAGKEAVLSAVFTAKLLLFAACSAVFLPMIFTVGDMKANKLVFLIAYAQVLTSVLFPVWYFQGMKNMRVVTCINVFFRLLSIPFIVIFVHQPDNLWIYVLVTTATMLGGGVFAYLYIIIHERLSIRIVPLSALKQWWRDGMPFFMSNITGQIKEGMVTIIVRYFFGYAEVTLYDIAKKLVMIPRMFTQSINGALFPEIIGNYSGTRVRKILKYNRIIGAGCSVLVMLLAYPAVRILFGLEMLDAVPLTVILCWSIYTWLIAGAYHQFVFIPNNKYYLITLNQVVALVSCLVCLAGLLLWHNILILVIALTLSGFIEILFCKAMTRKYQLL
ncbi:MAG: oligosaccharide flippase family protein [Paludibacteraceae bacterium]|nr:oligosaccharide flippase family protein [Paludibacteraceae bacterium]